VAPVVNWHSRQPEIIHQLMRQPPKVLPMGSGLCTIWWQACSPTFPMVPSGNSKESNMPKSFLLQLIAVTLRTKRPGISILVLKETRSPMDRVVVLPRTMRQAHVPPNNFLCCPTTPLRGHVPHPSWGHVVLRSSM